jgi:hypothetical protein
LLAGLEEIDVMRNSGRQDMLLEVPQLFDSGRGGEALANGKGLRRAFPNPARGNCWSRGGQKKRHPVLNVPNSTWAFSETPSLKSFDLRHSQTLYPRVLQVVLEHLNVSPGGKQLHVLVDRSKEELYEGRKIACGIIRTPTLHKVKGYELHSSCSQIRTKAQKYPRHFSSPHHRYHRPLPHL